MIKAIICLASGLAISLPLYAIDMDQVEIYGYGSFLFSNYDYLQNYQQDPVNKSKIDFERFVLSPRFLIDDNIKIVSEIEFEHGGTGSTMEYDTLDEFGEFENEVEKGGEVAVEEAYLEITLKDWFNMQVGHMVIPVGLNSLRHLPTLYLSSTRNFSETTIIPDTWHETGLLMYGHLTGELSYQASITNGLNSEFFDSSNWIKAGHQKRFEFVNANSPAFALRLDYGNIVKSHVGFSIYGGNTARNRHKSQLDVNAQVTIMDAHAVYDDNNIKLRALYMLGKLDNSEEVTLLNKSLPSALEAKKSPVANEALAYFVEAGYDIASFLDYEKSIIPFVKYDFVDSMHKTVGSVPNLDRHERTLKTVGINYFYKPSIVYKFDYATTKNGDKNIEDMNSYNLSLGYQF